MVNQLLFEQDMDKEVRVKSIHGSLFENDDNGLQVGVRITRRGVPETLEGTVICEVMRTDGTMTVVNGYHNYNVGYAFIPSACLMPGFVRIVLKNIVQSVKTTILAIAGTVAIVNGSAFIDPGSVIPDLTAYEGFVDRAETAITTLSGLSFDSYLMMGDDYMCAVTKE